MSRLVIQVTKGRNGGKKTHKILTTQGGCMRRELQGDYDQARENSVGLTGKGGQDARSPWLSVKLDS